MSSGSSGYSGRSHPAIAKSGEIQATSGQVHSPASYKQGAHSPGHYYLLDIEVLAGLPSHSPVFGQFISAALYFDQNLSLRFRLSHVSQRNQWTAKNIGRIQIARPAAELFRIWLPVTIVRFQCLIMIDFSSHRVCSNIKGTPTQHVSRRSHDTLASCGEKRTLITHFVQIFKKHAAYMHAFLGITLKGDPTTCTVLAYRYLHPDY